MTDDLRPCPRSDLHTPEPSGYVAWGEWAEAMSRTHKQRACPGCGSSVWVPLVPTCALPPVELGCVAIRGAGRVTWVRRTNPTTSQNTETQMSDIPGWEGTCGPFPSEYGKPHVYARDVHSGAGNCVCGHQVGHRLHVQAAPGVPIPEHARG